MRIIGGTSRGRRLSGPRGAAIRPTADQVKGALFNILADRIVGARFLDLFAGTGNIGLEALSRGATQATFVESNPIACRLLEANVRRCGFERAAEVRPVPVSRFLKHTRGPHQPGPAPVRQDLRGGGREPAEASGTGPGRTGGAGAPRHQGDSPSRSGAVPRSPGGFRPPAGSPRGDPGAPCRVGLRVRATDGAHEPQPGPERGDRLPHAQPGIHLSDVDDHQGSGPAGRRPRRPSASRDRPPAGRTPAGLLPMKLAQRVGRTAPSATLRITAEAKAMVARGVDVIDFASGEPDFDTPLPVKEAGIAAIRSGFTEYTAAGGIDELKLAVVEKLT